MRIVYASDIMAAMLRARRSPGTRTALDVLREWFRPPDPDAVAKLLDAMDAGQLVTRPVTVSCFLRGTAVAIPSHWRQGTLTLDGGAITWRRHLAVRPDLTRLPTKLDIEQVHKVAGDDRLRLKADLFRIIVCHAASGRIELGVPTIDVPLVRRAIQRDRRAPNP